MSARHKGAPGGVSAAPEMHSDRFAPGWHGLYRARGARRFGCRPPAQSVRQPHLVSYQGPASLPWRMEYANARFGSQESSGAPTDESWCSRGSV
jgi:hypothetical protein